MAVEIEFQLCIVTTFTHLSLYYPSVMIMTPIYHNNIMNTQLLGIHWHNGLTIKRLIKKKTFPTHNIILGRE